MKKSAKQKIKAYRGYLGLLSSPHNVEVQLVNEKDFESQLSKEIGEAENQSEDMGQGTINN